jgi:nucleotide-binding universal stress UspA family protein
MEDVTLTDPDRVLVGVDGSPASIEALRTAARMAEAFDAPLEVVTAWAYPPYSSPYISESWSPEGDAKTVLDDSIRAAFGDSPPSLRRTVLAGPTAHLLIEESRRCALLVLGSRGHGGFSGLLLGSVSAACAEHAHCPVLIVHNKTREAGASAPADAGRPK